MQLPPARITTTFMAADRCAVCDREWEQGQTPVPTVYTEASIEADDPPAPICDYCVEKHNPDLFDELQAERQREEALDVLVATTGTSDYVFGPGATAGSIFGLRKYVSTSAPAPVVCDASAVGRLYASPVSLQRFEENDGGTNSSLIRMELNALFGVERIGAAVRIAAS